MTLNDLNLPIELATLRDDLPMIAGTMMCALDDVGDAGPSATLADVARLLSALPALVSKAAELGRAGAAPRIAVEAILGDFGLSVA